MNLPRRGKGRERKKACVPQSVVSRAAGGEPQALEFHGRGRIVKPQGLRKGDRIGVISPAGPVHASRLSADVQFLEAKGFQVQLAPHVFHCSRSYLAGTDEERIQDLHELFAEPKVRAIFCTRGGYGTLRILDRIDYDLIRENPKILVGYSDITALLLAVYAKTGLVCFHGPMVSGLSSGHPDNWTVLEQLLSSANPHAFCFQQGLCLRKGRARGPLAGGNLSLLCHLLGTPFLPSLEGAILFLEDCGEAPYRLDRMLTHLKQALVLKGVSGLLAGRFEGCGEQENIQTLLEEITRDWPIPLTAGFPFGHVHRNLTLPIGIPAELDAKQGTLSLLEACVV